MDRQHTIYGLRQIDGPRILYVGQTSRAPNLRLSQHLSASRTGEYPLHRWIRKVGFQVQMSALAMCTDQDCANLCELWWIDFLGTHISKSGYNLSTGGGSSYGATWTLSTETRERQSQAAILRVTDEFRQNTSIDRREYFSDPDNREKHSRICSPYNTTSKALKANHTRWHESRGIKSISCDLCTTI